ncbi:hypothetical protein JX265_010698 [Neoarthrinium moseri]|uniref:Adhesin domain-containing protein n=1 Tax=Neoarthrinium moseri TaxID=1658444 RepID=A0A9P9WDJ3_9PEZI|nr:hypothetical protein JX266_003076 [Neoarthrinium moseri]KAI1858605.1 hypothetical protein JX265_010698 [Neoarthrinium moseri]
MYSLEAESDDEPGDQLSPSDGNFANSSSNVVPNVPNVVVPDPTVRDSETPAERKALEAKEDEFLNSPGHSQPQAVYPSRNPSRNPSVLGPSTSAPSTRSYSTRTSHTPPTSYAPSSQAPSTSRQPLRTHPSRERTPSLYSEAPPAYTPSQTTPLSPTAPSDETRSYNTFSPNMGVENERLLDRDPESMGPPDDESLHSPRWSKRIRRRLPPWLNWRVGLLAVVLLAITLGFLTSGYKAFKGGDKTTIRPTLPPDGVTQPPKTPEEPAQPGSPGKQPLEPTYCKNAEFRFPDQILAVDFSKGKFLSFIQEQHGHGGNMPVRVGGQVNIRQLDEGGYPRVVLETVTNDEALRLEVYMSEEDQKMRISVPKKFESENADNPPCIEMRATVWVPKNAELRELSIAALHLDVLTLDDLSIHVDDFAKLSSVVGDVVSAAATPRSYENKGLSFDNTPDFTFVPAKETYTLDSRVLEVSTTSGNIYGNWPLYDMLGLHSTAGSIKVSITPEPVLESNPKPAVLSMSSISGSIHATEPIHVQDQMPIREYLVDVKSTSGGIHCALAFGGGVELKSTASDIAVDLLPILDASKLSPTSPAQLETVTTSGTTAVRILEPTWFNAKDAAAPREFNCLQAVHKSTSANVGLRYPQSWVGDLRGETTSGRLAVKGKDVRVTKSSGGWPGSTLTAYKGRSGGGSTISVKTMLGSLDAVIGDE